MKANLFYMRMIKSVLITAKNDTELKNKVKPVLASTIEWFSANGLALTLRLPD